MMGKDTKIIYFFTTFPVLTETFLQREIRALRGKGIDIEIYSLWGGAKTFDGMPIFRFPKWKLITLLWRLPALLITKTDVLITTLRDLRARKMPSLINGGETFIGFCFAIIYAPHFKQEKPGHFHAVWASMPATATQLLSQLTGIPYSMGAHAYDVFEDGGDWLLQRKLEDARFIQTSTAFTAQHLRSIGAPPEKIIVIRRGLDHFPKYKAKRRSPRSPLRLLSVGRLIEKKGYFKQLEIYRSLRTAGIQFHAVIIGDGPFRRDLMNYSKALNLQESVEFQGPMDYKDVVKRYEWADLFIYTGQIARNGDRDGLPNVIPEAMASGVPVITSRSEGVCEAVSDGKNGVIIKDHAPENWIPAITTLATDDRYYDRLRVEARKWVETYFNTQDTIEPLVQRYQREIEIAV